MSIVPQACGQCPFKLSAPLGVWEIGHYLNLRNLCGVTGADSFDRGFFGCHQFRNERNIKLCAGWTQWQRMQGLPHLKFRIKIMFSEVGVQELLEGQDAQIYEDLNRMVLLNSAAQAIIEDESEGFCSGSFREVSEPDALKAKCPVCGQIVPSDGTLPGHLSSNEAILSMDVEKIEQLALKVLKPTQLSNEPGLE